MRFSPYAFIVPALVLAAPAAGQTDGRIHTHRGGSVSPGLQSTFHSPGHAPGYRPPGWYPSGSMVYHPQPGMPMPGYPPLGYPAPGVMYPGAVWPAQQTVVTNGAGSVRIERHARIRQSPGVAIGGGLGNRGSGASVRVTLPQQIDHREVTTIETFPAGVDPRDPHRGAISPAPATPEGITEALDDLHRAWMEGDAASIHHRLAADRQIRIFSAGRHLLSLDREQYMRLVDDRMTRFRTVDLVFDRPRSQADGSVVVTGAHVLRDLHGARQDLSIAYELQRLGGIWRITGADLGAS
jgi:hypothetical protein